MGNRLWIVGQYVSGERENTAWSYQGVFDSLEEAIKACGEWKNYFYVEVELNRIEPHENIEWQGVVYPNYGK